jgi:hypothetical protein
MLKGRCVTNGAIGRSFRKLDVAMPGKVRETNQNLGIQARMLSFWEDNSVGDEIPHFNQDK